MATKHDKQAAREQRLREQADAARRSRVRQVQIRLAVILAAVVAGLGGIFAFSATGRGGPTGSGPAQYRFVVAKPGLDARAPALRLASTTQDTWDLAAQRGKTTLLYFQEGLGCEPCWEQITEIERKSRQLKALGIDQMVSITGNDLGQLEQKAADERIHTIVLADPGLRQSSKWGANQQGMMGGSANGHSFIVVDPTGTIRARADYGGAPDFTMYLPVESLVGDLRKQLSLPHGA